jgi:hypothetical protein
VHLNFDIVHLDKRNNFFEHYAGYISLLDNVYIRFVHLNFDVVLEGTVYIQIDHFDLDTDQLDSVYLYA